MTITLTGVLLLFMAGFILHRHASVKIAAIACFVLGALVSGNAVVHGVVHTLDGVFRSLT